MPSTFDPKSIDRPDPILLRYYFFCALMSGPLFPLVFLQFWMRYVTLRYRFDDEGVWMSWGVFFRNETNLTYRRIQDIHLTANLLQRWMGLAKISLQTASGNAMAEMSIEGILQTQELRDFLYARMRGAKNDQPVGAVQDGKQAGADIVVARVVDVGAKPLSGDRTQQTLEEIRDALRLIVERQGAK